MNSSDSMDKLKQIENELNEIKSRNKRVEADKAWETSNARKILLSLFTYISVGAYLQVISIPNPWLNAVVPAAAFMLSTLTLPFFKKVWLRYYK